MSQPTCSRRQHTGASYSLIAAALARAYTLVDGALPVSRFFHMCVMTGRRSGSRNAKE
jgi:hypothetical protein